MGRRIGAWIIDVIILNIIWFAAFSATVETATVDFNPCDDPVGDDGAQFCTVDDVVVIWDGDEAALFEFGDTGIVWAAFATYVVLVFWVLEGLTGGTPGKFVLGIRTVNQQGDKPGIGRAAIRNILWLVDALPYCCGVPLVGGITAFASKGHRRVGDMAAKTYVVGKGSVGYEVAIPGAGPAPSVGAFPPAGGYPPATGFPPPSGFPPADQPPSGPTTVMGVADQGPGWASPDAPADPFGAAAPDAPAADPTAAAPAAGEPQWDPARNAYIQWDATQQVWLQFDDATQQWRPIQ
jgi:uncharacterized RDD family membrane protein YckC